MRRWTTYLLLGIGTAVAIEAGSFLWLLWKETRADKSVAAGMERLWMRHPYKHHRHAYGSFDPVNTQFLAEGASYVELKANRWGFIGNTDDGRNPQTYPDKVHGVIRIVLLGGSSAVGAGASKNSQTITAHLERTLKGQGLNAEVFNFGMFGASTYGELVRLLSEVAYLSTDVVIALDGWNDALYTLEWSRQKLPHPMVNWHQVAYLQFDYFHRISETTRVPPYVFTYAWLLVDSVFSVDDMGRDARKLRAYGALPAYRLSEVQTKREDFPGIVYRTNLKAMAAFCDANGIAFLHYLQPHPDTAKPLTREEDDKIERDYAKYSAEWGSAYDRKAVRKLLKVAYEQFRAADAELAAAFRSSKFLDITELFSETTERVYADVIHYNDLGNRLLAERISTDILVDHASRVRAAGAAAR